MRSWEAPRDWSQQETIRNMVVGRDRETVTLELLRGKERQDLGMAWMQGERSPTQPSAWGPEGHGGG